MDEQNRIMAMLQILGRPAFAVKDGCILHVNREAQPYLLEAGQDVTAYIFCGKEEYAAFHCGSLHLTLSLQGACIGATAVKMEDTDCFILDEGETAPELRAMALAAKELREPLAGILTVNERMQSALNLQADPQANTHAAQMNRRLFQLMRVVTNMSDAARYAQPDSGRMESVNATSLFSEIFEKAGALLSQAGLRLLYTGPNQDIYTQADPERLERAAYNLLSNAAKFAPKDSVITVSLQQKGQRLYLSVTDKGQGIANPSDIFTRYQREPGLEDSRYGLGLGLQLVRSAASVHGGAVLIEQPEGGGSRFTMSLQIRRPRDTTVRTPLLRIDYAGAWDHGLLELADCLPTELYQTI